ncbi:hypothetical protein [Pectobacterium polaris]|uniref:hypothetical protein n=1 Tax=Pectobacterium polaris TaxID=2042057 RepID=UPI0021C6FD5E|nr:hypothetical protein [Pectobacterium polaris]
MSIIKRCAGLIAAMAVLAAASPVFAQANLKEEKVLIVVSSLDKKTKKKTTGSNDHSCRSFLQYLQSQSPVSTFCRIR